MTKKYIRVDINSIDDLPKDGDYEGLTRLEEFSLFTIDRNSSFASLGETWWLNNVKWYFIPEPEEAQREELTDILNCIAGFDKDASIEEKGRYFESIQRDIVNYLDTK